MQNEPKPDQAEVNKLSPTARRYARRYALQAMYKWQITQSPIIEIEHEFLKYHISKPFDLAYFKELIHGIVKQQTELDDIMKPYMSRSLSDIDPIELSVLRLSTYELVNRLDVPYRVVINEALELTKIFGSIEGFKFVNGILDKIAKKIRATEINSNKPTPHD
jgi:N utilization substance protein B